MVELASQNVKTIIRSSSSGIKMNKIITNLLLCLFATIAVQGCGSGSSDSGSNSVRARSYSVSADALIDPHNFYPYLRNPSGQCIVPQNIQNSCHSETSRSITQLKMGPGFMGSSFGLAIQDNVSINIDPEEFESFSIYSGATATYTAKHYPVAVENSHYTYFVFSGPAQLDGEDTVASTSGGGQTSTTSAFFRQTDRKSNALGIYVARFNHLTNKVSAPLLIHVKHTDDPHDNAVLNFDQDGNLYIMISGRSLSRSALLYFIEQPSQQSIFGGDNILLKNITPPNINYSSLVRTDITHPDFAGVTYPKLLRIEGGFRLIYTLYCLKGVRDTCDGTRQLWSARLTYDDSVADRAILDQVTPLAAYGGHYAIAGSTQDGKDIAIAFNLLVDSDPANRTNLYVLYSQDSGASWRSITNASGSGQALSDSLPFNNEQGLDRIAVMKLPRQSGRVQQRIYLKDISLARTDELLDLQILYVNGTGANSHTPTLSDTHTLAYAYLGNSNWENRSVTREIDHNYSTGFISQNENNLTRLFFPATPENNNNGLAGGAPAYVDVNGATANTTYLTPLNKVGEPGYLSDLCEINYLRAVANKTFSGFVGLGSASNPYRFVEDESNNMLPASPMYIFDASANLYQLPMNLSDMDENLEMPIKLIENGTALQCNSSAF